MVKVRVYLEDMGNFLEGPYVDVKVAARPVVGDFFYLTHKQEKYFIKKLKTLGLYYKEMPPIEEFITVGLVFLPQGENFVQIELKA